MTAAGRAHGWHGALHISISSLDLFKWGEHSVFFSFQTFSKTENIYISTERKKSSRMSMKNSRMMTKPDYLQYRAIDSLAHIRNVDFSSSEKIN